MLHQGDWISWLISSLETLRLGRRGPFYVRRAEGLDQAHTARVVSAVWTIFNPVEDVAELGLTWPEGDGRRPTGGWWLDLA